MPILNLRQLEEFDRLYVQGKSDKEIAEAIGIDEKTVTNVRNLRFVAAEAQATPAPQPSEPVVVVTAPPAKAASPSEKGVSRKEKTKMRTKTKSIDVHRIEKLLRQGKTGSEIRKEMDIGIGSVYYWAEKLGLRVATKDKRVRVPGISGGTRKQQREKAMKQLKEILALQEKGLGPLEIREKLDLTHSQFYSRLALNKSTEEHHVEHVNSSNGAGSPNRNVLIGYAFAKTEEYIRYLSERTGLSETVLKQRLSELLGRETVREVPPRTVD